MKLFNLLLIFLLILPVAFAANVISDILDPLIGGLGLPGLYNKYTSFIDFTLYLILFLGIARAALEKQFKGRAGKAIIVALGIAFAFALAVWESEQNWNLSKLGPLVATLFILILVYSLYLLLKDSLKNITLSVAIVFLGVYFCLRTVFQPLWEWYEQNAPIIISLLQLGLILALIYGIYTVSKLFKKKEGEKKVKTIEQEKEKKDIKEAIRKATETNNKKVNLSQQLLNLINDLSKIQAKDINTDQGRQRIKKVVDEMCNTLAQKFKLSVSEALRDVDDGKTQVITHSIKQAEQDIERGQQEMFNKLALLEAELHQGTLKTKKQLTNYINYLRDKIGRCLRLEIAIKRYLNLIK